MFLKTNLAKHVHCYSGIPVLKTVLLTVHMENYHLDGCGFVNNSPHVHFLILLVAPLRTWQCSSEQNGAQLQAEVLMCLSEATELYNQKAAWVAFWGTENTAGGRQNFSDDTEITRKSQGQPDTWSTGSIYDPATAGAVSDTIMRDASLVLSVLTSPPPNLCPINFARTDNFLVSQSILKSYPSFSCSCSLEV